MRRGNADGLGSDWDGPIGIHNATSQSIEHARRPSADTKQLADEDGWPPRRLSHADRSVGGSSPRSEACFPETGRDLIGR